MNGMLIGAVEKFALARLIVISGCAFLLTSLARTYTLSWRKRPVPGMVPWGLVSASAFILIAMISQISRLLNHEQETWRLWMAMVGIVCGLMALHQRRRNGNH